MTTDSAPAVQAALYTTLAAAGPLTALLAAGAGSLCDHVPAGTAFPYVVLGEASVRSFGTQGVSGNDITATFHVYSRAAGMQEAKAILAALFGALHEADFTVTGHMLVSCRHLDSKVELEGDGLTRHGVARFRIITEPQ